MNFIARLIALLTITHVLYVGLTVAAFASENVEAENDVEETALIDAGFSGLIRAGSISVSDQNNNRINSTGIAAQLNYTSERWYGVSATGGLYSTQKLFNSDAGSFFASDGEGYTILGQAYLQANIASTEVKLGRFGFDSPHADRDDIRMVPNSFSGILVTNTDITDTSVYLAHLDKWSGVDATIPERFTDISPNGVNVLGIVYNGVENTELQGWFYNANEFANLFYLQSMVEVDDFVFGAQYSQQTAKSRDLTGPNGEVYGILAGYSINDFTFVSSYNVVSGSVVNGFGGGPFFTSAADHTIEGVIDQNAFSFGVDYSGFDNWSLGLLSVVFDKGENEIDVFISYDFGNNTTFDFTYHHLQNDGDMMLALINVTF